jgi:hypothetical protein
MIQSPSHAAHSSVHNDTTRDIRLLNNQVQHLIWQGVAMGTNYEHLTAEERATLMVMLADGCSQRRRCSLPWSQSVHH